MSFLVDWLVDQRVIHIELQDNVTMAQIEDIIEHIDQHVEQGVAPIHMIMDFTQVSSHPSMAEVRKISSSLKPDPKVGWTLVVGANPILRIITNVLFRISDVHYRNFVTHDDAIAFLQDVDDTVSFQVSQ